MKKKKHSDDWAAQANSRGVGGALRLFLEVIAPFGPLGAQLLYIVQPLSGILGWRQAVGEIAEMLEEPDGAEKLRQRLETVSQDSNDDCSEEDDAP